MLNRVAKRCQTCLIKQRSNPRNKRYLWIQVKERAQNACARKTCLTKPSKRTKCCTMFDQMFDGVQILSNTTKHDQTRSNNTKQGVQTGKCLVTKQCLIAFGHQTFPVWTGLYKWPKDFKEFPFAGTKRVIPSGQDLSGSQSEHSIRFRRQS